jgi:hypothetical protein
MRNIFELSNKIRIAAERIQVLSRYEDQNFPAWDPVLFPDFLRILRNHLWLDKKIILA